jgi:tRNA (guanine37-N1)-methyltransferase
MVVIDAVVRCWKAPGDEIPLKTSPSDGLLEYPHYTRPEDFRGMKVPLILLSGNHAGIAEALQQRIERTGRHGRIY